MEPGVDLARTERWLARRLLESFTALHCDEGRSASSPRPYTSQTSGRSVRRVGDTAQVAATERDMRPAAGVNQEH